MSLGHQVEIVWEEESRIRLLADHDISILVIYFSQIDTKL